MGRFRQIWAAVGGLPVAVALTSGPLAAGLAELLARRPDVVEAFWGERISRWVAMALGTVTGLLPVSVAELGALTIPIVLVAIVARRWVGARAFLKALPGRLVQAAAVGSAGYAVFLLVWGIGAHRRPLGETLGYDVRPAAFDELTGLYVELVAQPRL